MNEVKVVRFAPENRLCTCLPAFLKYFIVL